MASRRKPRDPRDQPPTRQEMARQARLWLACQITLGPREFAHVRETISRWLPDSASRRRCMAGRGYRPPLNPQ